MIDKRYAREQVLRLRVYDKWIDHADNRKVLDDLVAAAMTARCEAVCFGVLDEWISREEKMPTPATLRRMIWDENRKNEDEKPRCPMCGGCGFTVKWFLVTYRGASYSVERREYLADVLTQEAAHVFQERIEAGRALNHNAKRQVVLSGAAYCGCRISQREAA